MKQSIVFELFVWFSAIAVGTSNSIADGDPKVWNRRRLRSSTKSTKGSSDEYIAEKSKESSSTMSGKKGSTSMSSKKSASSKSGKKGSSSKSKKSSSGSKDPGFVFAEQKCTFKNNSEDQESPEMGDIALKRCDLHEVHAIDGSSKPEYTIGDKVGYSLTSCTSVDPEERLLDCNFQDILVYGKYMSQEYSLSTLRSDGFFLPDQAFPTVGGTGLFTNLQGVLILEELDSESFQFEYLHRYHLNAAPKEL